MNLMHSRGLSWVRPHGIQEGICHRAHVEQPRRLREPRAESLGRLRERLADVPLLLNAFLSELSKEYGNRKKDITQEVVEALTNYNWPGNIRELRNLCERLIIMGADPIGLGDLPEYITPSREASSEHMSAIPAGSMSLRDFRHATERSYIESTLRAYGWNVSKTSEVLGVERTNLHKKIKKYDIDRDDTT